MNIKRNSETLSMIYLSFPASKAAPGSFFGTEGLTQNPTSSLKKDL
jgi:hypothetical protein